MTPDASDPESVPGHARRAKAEGGMAGSAARAGAKPTTVLLVRHAKTPTTGKVLPGRAEGLGLSDEGREQAEARAEAIAGAHKVAAIYSSPMERAQQTAAAIGEATGKQVRIHEGLNECDFGRWTGRRLKSLYKLSAWQAVQRSPSNFRFPEGESFLEMQSRIVAALNELTRQHRGRTIVAVSHADTIKAAVAHALGMHLDMFQRLTVSPASQTAIQLTPAPAASSSHSSSAPAVLSVNA